jgi:hypothetical protein
MSAPVATCDSQRLDSLRKLFAPYRLTVETVGETSAIPGSFWGEPEAGLVGDRLMVRRDTPLHSALHEGCHFVCMDERRRSALHTDAGGNVHEENAVCYLQGLLADALPGYDRQRLFAEMDAWGYSFRLGSAAAWFAGDADDARQWLIQHDLIDEDERPTGRRRR